MSTSTLKLPPLGWTPPRESAQPPLVQARPQEPVVNTTLTYLNALNFRDDDLVCVSCVGGGQAWKNYFLPFAKLKTEASLARMAARNNDGQNIYISMAPFVAGTTERKKEFVAGVRHVFADDDEHGPETLAKVNADAAANIVPEPAIGIESSPGKVQVIWHVNGDFDVAKQEALNRAIQQRYGTDPSTVDTARVLRIPGFKNHKYHEKPVARVIQIGDLKAHPLAAFKIQAATTEIKASPSVTGAKIPHGQHDTTLHSIAGKLRHDGLEEESIYNALVEVVEKRCENYGSDYLDMCRKHAHNICKHPVGQDDTVYIGGRPAGTAPPQSDSTGQAVWGEPLPFEMGLPAVLPFDITCLPRCLRPLVQDVSERFGVPIEFTAATALNALAGVVGRRAFVYPREHDKQWKESCNLWGGLIAGPGDKKTPLINAVLEPLNRIRLEWEQINKTAEKQYEQELEAYEKQVKKLEAAQTRLKKKLAKEKEKAKANNTNTEKPVIPPVTGDDVEETTHDASASLVILAPPTPPTKRLFIVNECTAEYLQDVNAENPEGLFSVRDELSGLVAEMDSKGRELQRPLYLAAWSGNTVYGVGRMTREGKTGMLCWSLFGGFQPHTVQKFLQSCMEVVDGLFPRFQNFVWPDPLELREREGNDRSANEDAIHSLEKIFRTLLDMKEGQIELHFAKGEAQKTFNDWYHGLHGQIHQEPAIHIKQHLSKYPGLMPILAGLFQLADIVQAHNEHSPEDPIPCGMREIDKEHAEQAIKTIVWLESHARRIYSCIKSPSQLSAEEFAKHLLGGDLKDGFTARDVQRKGWTHLKKEEAVDGAITDFEGWGWLREIPSKNTGRGRPTIRYEVNPSIKEKSKCR